MELEVHDTDMVTVMNMTRIRSREFADLFRKVQETINFEPIEGRFRIHKKGKHRGTVILQLEFDEE